MNGFTMCFINSVMSSATSTFNMYDLQHLDSTFWHALAKHCFDLCFALYYLLKLKISTSHILQELQ